MNKQKKFVAILIFLISLILTNYNVFAVIDDEIEFSQNYLEYLGLSDVEKNNTIVPRMYDISESTTEIVNPLKIFSLLESSTTPKFSLLPIIPENIVVKNQAPSNTCWAFSSIASLESHLGLQDFKYGKNKVSYDFSEKHMDYATSRVFLDNKINEWGFNRYAGTNGTVGIATAYLTNGLGAIAEEDMKTDNNGGLIDISEIQNKKVITQVNDVVSFPSYYGEEDTTKIRQQMKEHIMNYGAINASVHGAGILGENKEIFNSKTNAAYCNSKSYLIDHAVSIIGWDDEFAIENFVKGNRPSQPGAWIVKNSWGEEFGENGFYYISYEDVNIYKELTGIENAKSEVLYENIYQYDEFGGIIKYKINGSSKMYMATEFDKKTEGKEYITQVSVNAPETYICKVYVNPNGTSKLMQDLIPVELKTGETETIEAGYHTLEFLNPVKINADSFVVVLEVQGNETDSIKMVIEMNYGEFYTDTKYQNSTNHIYDNVTIADQKCFFATENEFNNNKWRVTSTYKETNNGKFPNFDTTIKAFTTSKILESVEITEPSSTTKYVEGKNFDSSGMVVKGYYANGDIVDILDYDVLDGAELKLGQTSVTISYNGFVATQDIEVVENIVEKLIIKSPPEKTEYLEENSFESTGMEIEAEYTDGTKQIITDYKIQDGHNLNKDQTEVTIEYKGKTVTQKITVNEKTIIPPEKIVTGIRIKVMPTKRKYIQLKENLDLTGGIIEISYNNGLKEDIQMTSEKVVSTGFNNEVIGTQIITLTYEGLNTQFEIEIKELPKPVNSNFDKVKGIINGMKAYYFTNKDLKQYAVISIELKDIILPTENEKTEYYYYLSQNPNEKNITNWIKINDFYAYSYAEKLKFKINTLDNKNEQELLNSKTIYLYLKEVAIINNMKSEAESLSVPLNVESVNIKKYVDGQKQADIDSDTIVDSTPGEKGDNIAAPGISPDGQEDNTVIQGIIPAAGKNVLRLLIILTIFGIGRAAYLKYKDIKLK